MKKLLITLFLLVSSNYLSNAQEFAMGLSKTDFDTSKIIYKKIPVTRGGINGLPQSYSLKNFAPNVGYQGQLGSCTSWSAAYCALTICQRIETGSVIGPFDPVNLHSRLKALNSENPCDNGNYVEQAASLLMSNGCPEMVYQQSCSYVPANYEYDFKLSGHENLSINTYDFKYVLSQEKSPIVISANYFDNCWGNSANLVSGVWNGYCNGSGFSENRHAMVIIGYDDYKAGGAFLVQNSWGSNWGDNGYFWIRYNDVSKVVYAASQFKTNLNQSNDDFNNEIEILEEKNPDQIYRFYNDCSLTTYITLTKNVGQNWITRGWYAISSGSYIDLPIGDRDSNNIYWMATANNNGQYIDLVDNVNGTNLCFDRVNAHTIYDNSQSNCPNMANFYENVPDSRNNMVVTTLTCPNIKTRGEGTVMSSEQLFTEIIPGNEIEWDGKSSLIDAYSSRIIQPKKINNEDIIYELYYIEEKKVNHFKGSASELMKLKALKFTTEKNALAYLNYK